MMFHTNKSLSGSRTRQFYGILSFCGSAKSLSTLDSLQRVKLFSTISSLSRYRIRNARMCKSSCRLLEHRACGLQRRLAKYVEVHPETWGNWWKEMLVISTSMLERIILPLRNWCNQAVLQGLRLGEYRQGVLGRPGR